MQVGALKTLVVRASFGENKILAALYVNDLDFKPFDIVHPDLSGFCIYYSDPARSVALATQVLHMQGTDTLTEVLAGKRLTYGLGNFFQVNPGATELLLQMLREQVGGGGVLLDLYAGVGTLGYALADRYAKVRTLELDAVASVYAEKNAAENALRHVEVVSSAAEAADLTGLLAGADTVIIDPPRSGLHPRVLTTLAEAKIPTLVYVSCDPATQARDYAELRKSYTVRLWKLFDFYPQTPHVESVMVLEG